MLVLWVLILVISVSILALLVSNLVLSFWTNIGTTRTKIEKVKTYNIKIGHDQICWTICDITFLISFCYETTLIYCTFQGLQRIVKNILGLTTPSPYLDKDVTVPLLNREVIMNVNLEEKPRNSCKLSLTTFSTSRLLIMAIMAVGVCFGVCAVVLHPHRVSHIATAIHRCLFDNS